MRSTYLAGEGGVGQVRDRSWVLMMGKNLMHQPPDLSQYTTLPTLQELGE
jgi:hypothetical protein